MEPTVEGRMKAFSEFSEDSPAGRQRRAGLKAALEDIDTEEHGLGIEMNQRYVSTAVYNSDQGESPSFDTHPLKYYHRTTYPGARLPHIWLNLAVPTKPISTLDLAGKGRFTLFTGIGGQHWKTAVEEIARRLHTPIVAYSIGYGQDYEDTYLNWERVSDVDDSGCVLVRPDCFVAWRSPRWEEGSGARLEVVLKSILSLK